VLKGEADGSLCRRSFMSMNLSGWEFFFTLYDNPLKAKASCHLSFMISYGDNIFIV
jgi:hypothetical protein